MTVAPERPAGELAERTDLVTVTIDGVEMQVPKGLLIIRAAEQIGVQIPRFCDHPLLDPVGACRQCIVEVEGQRKPLTACTTTCTDGMVVRTQLTSEVAEKAQRGTMELLLLNHPLDCPVCDKGGECPLQNQAMTNGQAESRFVDVKRTYPKPIAISSSVLLDRERCVLCARCTRFSQQVAGDPFIELLERGALEQVGTGAEPFSSYFSGNTVQICPVGALTGAAYRFRARPFDLRSTPTSCEHCASGCAQRTDVRRGRVLRRLAGDDPAVNEEWNCDKGRWAFRYAVQPDRLRAPLVRGADGMLREASWPEALRVAAEGLLAARGSAGVLPGGRLTVEDAYAYAKFARVVLGTDDVDLRARPASDEETAFLGARVARRYAADGSAVTYADLEAAPAVVLAGFEPEEESPIVFLRLRKAAREGSTRVFSLAPWASEGSVKSFARLLPTAPGTEAEVLAALAAPGTGLVDSLGGHARDAWDALRTAGAVLVVGERLASTPGALTAAARLADASGARLAWVPRRAGERGAVEVGCLPGLLPGGRPVGDDAARAEVEAVWGVDVPRTPGRGTAEVLRAAADGHVAALLVGALDPDDLADPATAREALARVGFLVSLEQRPSPVAEVAHVVLPVAASAEKAGTYLDWEGRVRAFETALPTAGTLPDFRVLDALADEMDVPLDLPDLVSVRREVERLGRGLAQPADPAVEPLTPARPRPGQAVLATWRLLLDDGRLQDGEPFLAGGAKPSVVRLSAGTARATGVTDGAPVTLTGPRGALVLPAAVTEMPDGVVWVATRSAGGAVHRDLGAGAGDVVHVAAGGTLPDMRPAAVRAGDDASADAGRGVAA